MARNETSGSSIVTAKTQFVFVYFHDSFNLSYLRKYD